MKIAFPLINSNELASDFARSRFIGFYEESNKEIEVIPLEDLKNYLGSGAFPDILISRDLHAIVSMQINIVALRILKDYGIVVLKAGGNSFKENIQAFISGKLKPFTINESVFQEQCGGSCSACNSSCS